MRTAPMYLELSTPERFRQQQRIAELTDRLSKALRVLTIHPRASGAFDRHPSGALTLTDEGLRRWRRG